MNSDEIDQLRAEQRERKRQRAENTARLREVDAELKALLASLPNVLDPSVPDGRGPKDNVVLSVWYPPVRGG